MDYSTKVKTTTTAAAAVAAAAGATVKEQSENRINYRHSSETTTDAASSPLTSDQQDTAAYPCPACPIVLTTSRDLTNHLRGHNSPRSTDYSGEDDYSCGVCHKVLSSASSLDRHVLVHSGERPFKCKYCDMAFTTNGNMNRHLRTAHGTSPRENNGYTDSEASCDSEKSAAKRRHRNTIEQEYNNNEIGKRGSPDLLNRADSPSRFVAKRKRQDNNDDENIDNTARKHKIMLSDSRTELQNGDARNETTTTTTTTPPRTYVKNCPVCERSDFSTDTMLESHLERHHPEFPARCDPCSISFRNHRVLNLHKYMKHIVGENSSNVSSVRNLRNSVVGFHDLTFVDFSSDKFPAIARAVCEQSLHRPASGEMTKFQCDKCLRAFPCRSALDGHEMDCGIMTDETLIRCRNNDSTSRRDDFFAGLDLQNRAVMNEAKEGKDLADIQSIISVTSGPILQNFPRSDASTPEHQQTKTNSNIAGGSSGSSGTPSSTDYHQEEEAQDAFAAEFRRMKLKGEFPCRLCEAVFPNLRALKGHNRSHMGVGPGMPYPCNMCPYTSNDKGTLVRHLRSHNGDRPFECSLCNFAFTTKANCERHVRNRHGKVSREEIKSVIIYHPSEDSTNDSGSLDRGESRREDARKTLVYPGVTIGDRDENSQRRGDGYYLGLQFGNKNNTVGGSSVMSEEAIPTSLQSLNHEKSDVFTRAPSRVLYSRDTSQRGLNNEENDDDDDDEDDYDDYDYDYEDNENDYGEKSENSARLGYNVNSRSSDDDGTVSLVSDTKTTIHQRVQASPIDLKKSATAVTTLTTGASLNEANSGETSIFSTGEDAPLDLSMDVLDLSKKSIVSNNNESNNPNGNKNSAIPSNSPSSPAAAALTNHDGDFGRNQKEFYDATNQFLLTQALLKAGQAGNPATSLEALYANAHMIYRNFGGFSAAGVGAGILPPYLFNPHMFGQDFAIKDRLQKELVRGLQLTSGGNLVEPPIGNTAFAGAYPPVRETTNSRAEQSNDYGKLVASKLPPKSSAGASMREAKIDSSQSSSSVKMVIKNGVLMPKQKQRRYRTERPFTCEHCSARFTLRSNMERHIKQQHPQHWSQRPRGGHSTRGRPPANPPSLVTSGNNHSSNNPMLQQQSCASILPKIGVPSGSLNYEKHSISDQVKYAILAQQLKGSRIEENDTEEELIIDEAAQENRETLDNESLPHTTSLLRGKLEGISNLYKENLRSQHQQHQQQQQQKALDAAKKVSHNDAEETRREDDTMLETMEAEDCRKLEIKMEPNDDDEIEIERKDDYCAPSQLCVTEMTKIEQQSSSSRDGITTERNEDLASVSELLDNASQQYQQFQPQYMSDEEGLVASTSDCNNSGSDEKSDSVNSANSTNSRTSSRRKKKTKKKMKKKKSAYSMAPNRVMCPFCQRPFPWTSSLRRHILTHTGQKPFQCMHCSLLFTTKSNCDRHLLRKHKNNADKICLIRNFESPEPPEQPSNNNNTNNNNNNISSSNNNNNNNNTNNNNNNNNSSSSAFAMRNVPERPYKCNLCPSSTFSTLGNLKKHKSSKHTREAGVKSRAESPVTSEPRNSPLPTCNNQNDNNSGYESQSSSVSENIDNMDGGENLENSRTTCPPNIDETMVHAEIHDNNVTTTGQSCEISTRDGDNLLVSSENIDCTEISENTVSQENATAKCQESGNSTTNNETTKSRRLSPRSSPGPTDAPFKCHLCDSGFAERQDCLEHIRINHARSYEILVAKGALDMDIETPEEQQQQLPSTSSLQPHTSDGEEKRGRFPDYSNRKVVCAFCMRRFWSAEDLRRHMRTHTGERPFSCDICCRRFTLKHSMLRHRKKHESVDSMMYVGTSGDEDNAPSQPPTTTPRSQQQQHSSSNNNNNNSSMHAGTTSCDSRLQDRISLPTVATVATGDAAAPSGLMRFNPYEKLATLTGKMANAQQNFNSTECPADTDNDLISNLLGIRDKSIIDKVLQASADDAAKLLGVNRHHD